MNIQGVEIAPQDVRRAEVSGCCLLVWTDLEVRFFQFDTYEEASAVLKALMQETEE